MTSFSLGLAASPWIVALVIAAGFAFALYTYRRTTPPVGGLRRWTLVTLRTLGIALLLFTLFEPVLSLLRVSAEDPVAIVAIDNSESMTLGGQDSSRIAEARAIAARLETKLGGRVQFVAFSDSLRPIGSPTRRLDARGPETRLEAPFTSVADSLRRRNVRAVVVLSDGRYNAGPNPLFSAEALGVPVFSVGLGDSVPPRDLSLAQLFTNEVAYAGAELPVEVRARATGYPDGSAVITLRDDNGPIARQQVNLAPGDNEYTANFTYVPRSEGTAKLRAEVSGPAGELTPKNNSRTVYVKVKPNKRRYVLIAGAPSPDVAFTRRILAAERSIEVKTFVAGSSGEFIEGNLDAAAFTGAEAVVLIDFPTSNSRASAIQAVKTAVTTKSLPLLVVLGSATDLARLKELESVLPVTIGAGRREEMQVSAQLTESGRSNPITRVPAMEAWEQMPPIFRTDAAIRAKAESEVLARAKLGGTVLDEPLIVSRRLGRSRSLMVAGYGIYRWQLLGEGPSIVRGEKGRGVLEDFLGNGLRWLAAGGEKQVRIVASKQLYGLGESVRILAQTYDESFNPVSDAAVTVSVAGPRPARLVLAPLGNGRYEGALSNLPAGDYSFDGRASAAGRELGTDGGRFAIGEVGIEFQEPSMNVELMRALAGRTGGKFYTARSSNTLADDIVNHKGFAPRSVDSREDSPLWHLPWLLAAALAAFSIEWFIRKRSGMM